jgi:hypothetical protein
MLLFYDGFEGLLTGGSSATAAAGIVLRYAENVGSSTTLRPASEISPLSPTPGSILVGEGAVGDLISAQRLVAAHAAGRVGVRLLPFRTGGTVAAGRLFRLRDNAGNVTHLTVTLTSGGEIAVYRGTADGTLLGTSSGAGLSVAAWVYLEVGYVIDDSSGGVWVKVDGSDVLRLGAYALTPTTLDTRNGGNATIDAVGFHSNSTTNGNKASFDDWYIVDTSGSAPYNDFLGDVRVLEIIPNGAGDETDFTPNSGNNWQAVDETPGHDGDTSYVESNTAGDEDLYAMTDPVSSATTVYAAKIVTVARKTDAGDSDLELSIKSGSTTDRVNVGLLSNSYAEYTSVYTANPDGPAAWTIAALDSVQVGQRVPV